MSRMITIAIGTVLLGAGCIAAAASAHAQAPPKTVYKVLAVTSGASAFDAAANMTLKIADWAANGWTPVNITSADVFSDTLKEGTTQKSQTEWDVYVLLTCTPTLKLGPAGHSCARLTPP